MSERSHSWGLMDSRPTPEPRFWRGVAIAVPLSLAIYAAAFGAAWALIVLVWP